MTDLQKRMIESLQLRGMSERTQEAYVRAVRQLAQHYHKSPDLVTEEEVRQYFLYIKNVKKYARATTTIALCGIKFFVEWTLGRKWTLFELVRPPREKKLPTILSVEEARKDPRMYQAAWLPRVLINDLLVRAEAAGGNSPSSGRYRQRSNGGSRTSRIAAAERYDQRARASRPIHLQGAARAPLHRELGRSGMRRTNLRNRQRGSTVPRLGFGRSPSHLL
jgi:hypothetical protein